VPAAGITAAIGCNAVSCPYFRTDIAADPRYQGAVKKNTKGTSLEGLSPRERQVLKLVVEGRTSKEIAAIVGVQPGTVDTYRSRLMAKLELGDVASLVRFAIRSGLIKA
jgi:DNA-binding CsgD family transcriptional regulator